MHRCLTIPELVESIAEMVRELHQDAKFKAKGPVQQVPNPLFSMVLTCRAFYEPTMNVLWDTLSSLIPLMKCFPGHVWKENDDGKVRSVKPPSHEDWDRFLRNARRVRTLVLDHSEPASRDCLQLLSIPRPAMQPFPGLKFLLWVCDTENTKSYLNLFIGPRLERLWLMRGTSSTQIAMFEAIRDHAPNLELLIFGPSEESPGVDEALSMAMLKMSRIRIISSEGAFTLSGAAFAHIGTLSTLVSVDMHVKDGQELIDALLASPLATFPVLSRIHFVVKNLGSSSLTDLMRTIQAPQLRRVILEFEERPSATELRQLFRAVATHRSVHTVEVSLSHPGARIPPPAEVNHAQAADISTLLPLLALSNLRNLVIGDIPVYLDSAAIQEVASSWQKLELLKLEPEGSSSTVGIPTANELVHFAKHCPSLRTLHIWVDTLGMTLHDYRPGMGHVCESLTSFYPGRSPISDVNAVAVFLSDIFPNAKIQSVSNNVASADAAKIWSQVACMVPLLGQVRKQERKGVPDINARDLSC
ncbi:unnamed protein product [Somion occarium]|uniref:F-box domain-containing protein n=1 Tax=Somion occarium TaxID=3059160 RepID=A0ABP1DPF0_9APHY